MGRHGVALAFFFLCLALNWDATFSDLAPTPAPTLSGCQVCSSTHDCSAAYLGGPGQYCGPWFDRANQRQSCCCPLDATCKLSNYACNCSRKNAPAHVSTGGWVGVAVGAAVMLSCCIGGCWCAYKVAVRSARRPLSPPVATATAVPVVGGVPPYNVVPTVGAVYAAPAPVGYPYAMAPTAPTYDYGYGHSYGHGGGFSSGLGTVAGLATGMVVADMVFDGGHHHHGGFDGGDGFGGGGFDGCGDGGGGGDFGGDF